MKSLKNKKIIVLIILIIILIIFAGITESSVIKRLSEKKLEATYKDKIRQMEEDLNAYVIRKASSSESYDRSKLDANLDKVKYNNNIIEGESITDIIPDVETKELAQYEIKNGQLEYTGNDEKKKELLKNDTIEDKANNQEIISITNTENSENAENLNTENTENVTSNVVVEETKSTDTDLLELEQSYGSELTNYKIYGNTIQNGIPTIEAKVPLQSLGENGNIEISVNNKSTVIDLSGHAPLRKIEDTCDFIDYESGNIVRNVGEITFNGGKGENWYTKMVPNKGLYTAATFVSDAINESNLTLLSDRFLYSGKAGKEVSIFIYGKNGGIHLTVPFKIANSPNKLKKWLKENNVEVYYKLAEPKIEKIDLPKIYTETGNNTLKLKSNIESSGIEAIYKKYK